LLIRYRLLITNSLLILALTGTYWARRTEGTPVSGPDFLRPLNLPFRGWSATDRELTDAEARMLKPDAVVIRAYRGARGERVELAVIAGHRKETVHTPGFCMQGGGWELLSEQQHALDLPGGRQIPVVRSVMTKEGAGLVATYFFTDGDYSTRSLVQFQVSQLLKRLRGERTMGALVRVLVPLSGDKSGAEALSDKFVQAVVPRVLDAVRECGSPGRQATNVAD
jgi:EpsI family protein